MTAAEIERLAVVEEKMDAVCDRLSVLEAKLDTVLNTKADKSELARVEARIAGRDAVDALTRDFTTLQRLVMGLVVTSAGFAITTLVGLFVYLLQNHLVP